MEKKMYVAPEAELVEFGADTIATSTPGGDKKCTMSVETWTNSTSAHPSGCNKGYELGEDAAHSTNPFA